MLHLVTQNPNDFTLFNNLQLGTKECLEKHCCFLIESKIVDDDDDVVGSKKVYVMNNLLWLVWLAGFLFLMFLLGNGDTFNKYLKKKLLD